MAPKAGQGLTIFILLVRNWSETNVNQLCVSRYRMRWPDRYKILLLETIYWYCVYRKIERKKPVRFASTTVENDNCFATKYSRLNGQKGSAD